jgi:hypothetical protein
MSVQDDKAAGQEDDQPTTEEDSGKTESGQLKEKPEPDAKAKEKAAEMMTAYEDRPTLVLPGSQRMVTGTAVNDWLDEDGNPKCEVPEGSEAQGEGGADPDQIEKDKALNEELREASAAENKGEKS